jgi:hypothetical protein
MNDEEAIDRKGGDQSAGPNIQAEALQALAKFLEIKLKPEHSVSIAAMLSQIRQSVSVKVSVLPEDLPLSTSFDAR